MEISETVEEELMVMLVYFELRYSMTVAVRSSVDVGQNETDCTTMVQQVSVAALVPSCIH